jgi:hypothetical protein
VTLAKGLGGGYPIGACHRAGPGGGPARAGSARQYVRRQPAGGPRRPWRCSTRSRASACSTTPDWSART